jgi:putative transposase
MPRRARIVLPGFPHHVTQRGNRRQQTFFEDADYALYRDLMAAACATHGVRCWAWCLMPNHVHLVLEPAREDALALAVGEAHRRYTRHINAREGWTGFLWQGRFASCAMDESHALAAVRYVENNPVTAKLCAKAWDWPWSSAGFHVGARPDGLTQSAPWLDRIPNWTRYLQDGTSAEEDARLGDFTQTGYPLGQDDWIDALETKSKLRLRPGLRGRPRKPER